jgi:hypothetical protein
MMGRDSESKDRAIISWLIEIRLELDGGEGLLGHRHLCVLTMQWDYGLAKADEKARDVLNKEREDLQEQVIESEKTTEKEEEGGRLELVLIPALGDFRALGFYPSKDASSALIGKVKSITHHQ